MYLLRNVPPDKHSLKSLNDEEVKIQHNTKAAYSTIAQFLEDKNTQLYTFQMEEDRSFRVVLRNMHHKRALS